MGKAQINDAPSEGFGGDEEENGGQEVSNNDTAELHRLLAEMIADAETGIASEQLGGNVVKEAHWKGELVATTRIKQWIEFTEEVKR